VGCACEGILAKQETEGVNADTDSDLTLGGRGGGIESR